MENQINLNNLNVGITGASQGFGFEIAKKFSELGANILITSRSIDKLKIAKKEILKNSKGLVEILKADISIKIDNFKTAEYAISKFGRIDVLVANAGVYGPKGKIEKINWENWSKAIDINLKGTVLSCISVLPEMKKNNYGKIIILSGGGATKPMPNLSAYAASKAAVVRFAETLSKETKDNNIDVNTVAPGALNTRLLDEIIESGPENVGEKFHKQALLQQKSGGTPFFHGVNLCIYLANKISDGITGKLISSIWDPWKNFENYKNKLKNSDIYTLRRIIPEERNEKFD